MNNLNPELLNAMISDAEAYMDQSNLLMKADTKSYFTDGTFKHNTWCLQALSSKRHIYFTFDPLYDIDNINETDIAILKCYFSYRFEMGMSPSAARSVFRILSLVLTRTNNFSGDTESLKQDFNTLYESFSLHDKKTLRNATNQYLSYLMDIGAANKNHRLIFEVVQNYSNAHPDYTHVLPHNQYIFEFQAFLYRFFYEKPDANLVVLYFPLLLWWKITTIIPMRISEFTFHLSKDCAYSKAGKKYIHINRAKQSRGDLTRNGILPLRTEYVITDEIYDLIHEYLQKTSFDNKRKTLISLLAKEVCVKKYYSSGDPLQLSNYALRGIYSNNEDFLAHADEADFNRLLVSFYRHIILGYYHHMIPEQEWLTGNDTRYIAFMSLLLQGLGPIELAEMGGHTTVTSLWHYISDPFFYIESEILTYMNSSHYSDADGIDYIRKKLSGMPNIPPVPRFLCSQADDGIGLCTRTTKHTKCPNVDACFYCDDYWADPTDESFIGICQYIDNVLINDAKQKLLTDIATMRTICKNIGTKNMDGQLFLDENAIDSTSSLCKSIASDTQRLIALRKHLIEKYPEPMEER